MQIHRINYRVPGLNEAAYDGLRLSHMVTQLAEGRVRILAFFDTYGLAATREAFKVSKATLYRWKAIQRQGKGRIDSLKPNSTTPLRKRKRLIPSEVERFLLTQRAAHPRIGKDKLKPILAQAVGKRFSSSTIGRMLADLKKQGKLPEGRSLSYSARTDSFKAWPRPNKKPKQRPQKGFRSQVPGDLLQLDTIVIFKDGLKRYLRTAIDTAGRFAFAYGYPSHTSAHSADFLTKLHAICPFSIQRIQTDNGSEFAGSFSQSLGSVAHFHTYPKTPKMNAFVERFNRTIQEEFVRRHESEFAHNLPSFNRKLMDYLIWYNTVRPHQSLGFLPPLRYCIEKSASVESHMWWTYTRSLQTG